MTQTFAHREPAAALDDPSELYLGTPPTKTRLLRVSVLVVAFADVLALALPATSMTGGERSYALFAAVFLLTLVGSGSYLIHLHLSLLEETPGLLLRSSSAFFIATLLSHVLDADRPPIGPVVVATVALLVFRAGAYALVRWARTRGHICRPTLIVGGGFVGLDIMQTLRQHPEYGLSPVGFIDNAPSVSEAPALGAVCDVDEVIRRYHVRDIIVAYGTTREADLVHLLRTAARVGVEVYVVPRFFDIGIVPRGRRIDHVWGVPLVRVRRGALRLRSWWLKRTIDAVVSAAILIVFSPVFLVLALAVKLSSPGPVFYRQRRIGQHGREIDVLKFRSLRMADEAAEQAARDRLSREEIQAFLASTVAARQTAIGTLLRKTSLDELPQLINVLRGEMSLVGPRPEQPPYASEYASSIYGYAARHRLPVGLTGLAQVNGLRGDSSIPERARFDNYYIENWSPWMDICIALRTFGAVLRELLSSGEGGSGGDEEPDS